MAGVSSGRGTKHFGELKKSIGSVSQKVLTAQLRGMEKKGLLDRKVYAPVPLRAELAPTPPSWGPNLPQSDAQLRESTP